MDETFSRGAVDWNHLARIARRLPPKTNLVVPKSLVPQRPPHRRTRLGRRRGAACQYRDRRARRNLHVKEYPDRWVVHVDAYNPHVHLVRHLLLDHGYNRFLDLTTWLDEVTGGPQPVEA
jgi:hypothetical protein